MKLEDLTHKLDDFDHFYNAELKPVLEELEKKRDAAVFNLIIGIFIAGIILIIAFVFIENKDYILFPAVPVFLIIAYLYRKVLLIRRQAKYVIMPEICDRLGITYNPVPVFNATDIFSSLSLIPTFNEKKLEDEVTGVIEGVDFNLFEAKLIKVSRGRKGRKRRRTVFKGLLGRFDFHKNFKGTTVISGDLTALGNFLTGWVKGGDRVKLEDPEFENKFEVHSTDQVEARYLLTPTFMERIMNFSRLPTIEALELAFYGGHLYMSIKRDENYFEGDGHDLDDPQLIKEIIKDIVFIFDIITELKLTQNTRV